MIRSISTALVAIAIAGGCSKKEETPSVAPAASSAVSSAAPAPSPSASASAPVAVEASVSAPAAESASAAPVAAASASGSAKTAKTFACGGGDKPKCPVQNWMNGTMKPAMTSGEPEKVAALLRKIAGMAPASYVGWAKIANDAAAAVEAKKDVSAAKPSCTKCHEQFKKRWKAEDRDRPL